MQIRMAGATDVGRRRKANQDSIFFDAASGVGIVADGIGGRKGGEVASALAVNGLRKAFQNTDMIRYDEVAPFLAGAIDKINQDILARGVAEAEISGMGTTLNCLLFTKDRLHIAHIGDSRTYMYFERHLYQLTQDHNVASFLAKGWLSPAQIQPGAKGEALVRALGLVSTCETDIYEVELKPGQIFLTCSDGLTGMVDDREIADIIAANRGRTQELPAKLIDAANRGGGKDNITVLISEVRGR